MDLSIHTEINKKVTTTVNQSWLTTNFDPKRQIDLRAFAIKLCKGCLQHDDGFDYTVAIKRFNVKDIQALEDFKNEI